MAQYEELSVDQGSSFKYQLTLSGTSAEVPFDLTGYTGTAHIKRNYQSTTPTETFLVQFPVPSLGTIELNLSDEQTAAIRAGRYVYDVSIESAGGQRFRVLEGIVTVNPAVTVY